MIADDNAPNHVFKIGELARLIASHLILVSQQSAVNLARTCRYLEEPALSTLWETQDGLDTLLKVLPDDTWIYEHPMFGLRVFRIAGDPSPEAWKRVQRYASWMHRVSMHEWWSIGGDTFPKFRVNTPVGGWFPALQDLSWCITKSNLPHVDLFFSPHLKKVSIYASWSESTSEVSHEILPVIASTLSTLPVSTLQSLFFGVYPLAYFKDSFSSVVLRCGSPLTALASMIPLSGVATDHLIHLPQLRAWDISGPPPTYSALPLPLVFPPLVELTLEGGATREWFSLFERLEGHVRATQGVTPLSSVKESLETLCIKNCPSPIIDARFASPIQMFHNLITLSVETFRCNPNGERRCTFKLNNGDVTELAAALPRLEFLILGRPCPENTCTTTVACLLQISVHCVKLRTLDIHFNTANIIDGLKEISGDPRFPELRSLPSFTTVVNGKADIFPRLEHCEGSEPACIEFSKRLTRL